LCVQITRVNFFKKQETNQTQFLFLYFVLRTTGYKVTLESSRPANYPTIYSRCYRASHRRNSSISKRPLTHSQITEAIFKSTTVRISANTDRSISENEALSACTRQPRTSEGRESSTTMVMTQISSQKQIIRSNRVYKLASYEPHHHLSQWHGNQHS
jgi:hypothetical protein